MMSSHPQAVLVPVPDLPAAPWQAAAPRHVEPRDWERYEAWFAQILTAFGLDLDTEGTRDTPRRFLRALYDATEGYEGDPKLLTVFPAEGRAGEPGHRVEQVLEGPIAFHALCEHHALPFHGTAHVAYVPGEAIIGISKLTRLVRLFARRFTVQERIGQEVADALAGMLGARGVAVRLEAAHLCTQLRGVREHGSLTTTTAWRGVYVDDADLRREFLAEARS
jgi:GTP cyclohydrolase I